MGKVWLVESISFSNVRITELKLLQSLRGIFLYGITVVWVCGLGFIRNKVEVLRRLELEMMSYLLSADFVNLGGGRGDFQRSTDREDAILHRQPLFPVPNSTPGSKQ